MNKSETEWKKLYKAYKNVTLGSVIFKPIIYKNGIPEPNIGGLGTLVAARAKFQMLCKK